MTHPQRRPTTVPPDSVLITDAARSYEDDLATRKRRYALTMGMRVPFMILAVVFYDTPWLAVTLLVLSVPLPWMAVLIANDRLPRKREKVNRYRADRRSLEARAHPVIDAPSQGGPVVDGVVLDSQDFRGADRRDGDVRADRIPDGARRRTDVRGTDLGDRAGRDARRAG